MSDNGVTRHSNPSFAPHPSIEYDSLTGMLGLLALPVPTAFP